MQITNLTPHPVTIHRPGREPVTYPACAPADLPRATEAPFQTISPLIHDDTQASCWTTWSYRETGLVEEVGYTGVLGLPPIPSENVYFTGVGTAYIVSIVTAIGAIAGGRCVADLLIPMGQVRDTTGRIIGATGLAPAETLLGPAFEAFHRRVAAANARDMDRVRAELDPGFEERAVERAKREGVLPR